jgi:hypothetical protein
MERKGSVNRTLLHIAGIPSLPDRVASSETTALEARMASDFNPHEIQRALDKATDEEYDRHQDDGKYAENNNPLHLSDLHPDRAAQFAFHHNTPEAHNPFKDLLPDHKDLGVGQHEAPVNLTHYKSPMAMEPLHLDEHGNSWRRHYKWSHPDARVPDFRGWSGPHSATETLNQHPTWSQSFDADGKRHHHMRTHLEREQKAGVLPGETHGELVQRRNKALSQGGWSVLSAAGRIAEQMREKLGPGSANSVPVQKVATEEGWVGHRPPGPNGTGAPLHDLNDVHGQHGGSPFGTNSDVYSHPQHWTGFHDHELDRTIKSAEGKPDAPITIYRAQPAEHHGIRSGDWVTTSANYAHIHGADGFDGPVHVVKAVVPAHHVWTNADDIAEAGYHGPHIEHALHHADVED